jgi:hypothetical protein
MFGLGPADIAVLCEPMHKIGYEEGVGVQQSRHSRKAVKVVQASMNSLGPVIVAPTAIGPRPS